MAGVAGIILIPLKNRKDKQFVGIVILVSSISSQVFQTVGLLDIIIYLKL
jgi:hypothetical protein